MSIRPTRYFAAKVNIHGNIFSPNLDDLINIHLPNAIQTSESIRIGKWNWSFTDIKRTKVNGEEVIYGHITKSRREKKLVKRDDRTVEVEFPEELANNAFFLYHIKSELLMHSTTSSIPRHKFIEVFEELISQDIHVGQIKVKHIPESRTIRQELKSIEKAVSITFNLIHPNPTHKDDFNTYNQIIHQANVKEADVKLIDEDGFNLTVNDSEDFTKPIEDGISLVENGYGTIKFRGFNKKVTQTKKGKKKIVKDFKNFTSNSDIKGIKTKEKGSGLVAKLISFLINLNKD